MCVCVFVREKGDCVCVCVQESGVIPDQRTMGTLLHNATVKLHYEYLIALMKVRTL